MTSIEYTPITQPLDLALDYASRGWPVLPCHTVLPNSGGCTCGDEHCSAPGKHPVASHGALTATTDLDCVRRWWAHWPRANVAIRTGLVSKLIVVNIDVDHGGLQTLRSLGCDRRLPNTLTVTTSRGGLHLYFRQPCSAALVDRAAVEGPGLTVCSDGDYVIAPPSMHASGTTYARTTDAPVLRAPEWLCRAGKPARLIAIG